MKNESINEQLEISCHCFIQEVALNPKPIIAAWGLVKAGKSSLLNMLSGHIEDEFFKTGATRTTRLNQVLETDHYLIMDTPGLGIDHADSQQAYSGLDTADVVLFVHSPPGELDEEEMSLISQVKATFDGDTEQRLVIVLSQLDKNQNGALESVQQRILEQLQEQFSIQPKCFMVSNTRHRKGTSQQKQMMIDSSGIQLLSTHIDELVQTIEEQLSAVRITRRAERKATLLKELELAIEAEQQELTRLQDPYLTKVRTFNLMMIELRKNFSARALEIDSIQNTLNGI